MKTEKTGPNQNRDAAKHPEKLKSQQAVAEKSAGNTASVKARVESPNMPDKQALHRLHNPNSSGRK